MKNILLVGLGRFGRHIAQELHALGHMVLAVDRNEERVNRALPFLTNAQIGDSTSEAFLSSLGVGDLTCASSPSATIFRILWRPPPC